MEQVILNLVITSVHPLRKHAFQYVLLTVEFPK